VSGSKSLKDLLLIHELAFILLIILAGASGAVGIHLWDKSSLESQRINQLVQEIQQTRGDLYRQMKELFDAYFLNDIAAEDEYNAYTASIEQHFATLRELAEGEEERSAIRDLQASYEDFLIKTRPIFDRQMVFSSSALEKKLNTDLESDINDAEPPLARDGTRSIPLQPQQERTCQECDTTITAPNVLCQPCTKRLIATARAEI